MKGFNLSDWALNHRSLVWYFMAVFLIAGVVSYVKLGREEDPHFTIKTMVVQANWPGASVEETLNQVTDRIEKKLEELDGLDFTRSVTTAGQSVVFVNLKSTIKGKEVEPNWVRVRNMLDDIRSTLPEGVYGPYYNDRFGDVFGNIYAFTADGLSMRQLRDYAEDVRSRILTIANAGKVELIGAQDEAIYLEFSTRQVAALGLDQQAILDSLQAQNAITPSGVVQAGPERISVQVSGQFTSEEDLRAVNLRVNDRFFRLSDVATITRGYVDPPKSLFRVNGETAIGLAIGMKPNGNLLEFGTALEALMQKTMNDLPVGIAVTKVADQPEVVDHAVSGFTRALFEAVVIVLAVSFVSLGFRAGLVVSLSIPLVLAITFLTMSYMDISLQRVSLGALIIALGLLVDDAMIAVEMMVARLEQGDPLNKAATYVYSHTAFPMLTGTLVTIAGFIPIGLNSSQAGEYTYTLFIVIGVSLLVSWIVAVLFAPLLGVTLLPAAMKHHSEEPGRVMRAFSRALLAAMRFRWITIVITVVLFAVALFGMTFIERQFFPESDRPELVIDWRLPENSSIADTSEQMVRFEETVLRNNPDIDHWSSYIGQGAVRFVLAFDVQLSNPYYGQMVIVARDIAARDRLRQQFNDVLRREFAGTDAFVKYLELGPPVGRPVQYRVSGPDIQTLRGYAQQLSAILDTDERLGVVAYDWNEPGRVVRVDVLQDKARKLGISSKDIATTLNGVVGGIPITQVRDATYLVNVVVRAREAERNSIETLQNLQIATGTGNSVPLAAIADFRYELEQPVVWRRGRIPTITISAGIVDKTMPDTIVTDIAPEVDAFAAGLPAGYKVETAGTVEESANSQGPIAAVVPLMLFVMATILMLQLQSFQSLFLVVAVAPLGIIGVSVAMLLADKPLGFVAILGVLALIGILIRNSVILIVQVEDHIRDGAHPWDAVVDASTHRMRPIALTAAAASLALIPISREVFWGPMAFAMMGGIIAGTAITLLFLPALYVAWHRVKEPVRNEEEAVEA
ncbi:ACR family transporter [Aquamicrobium defluvii]|uniref:ACR family transporter n=2 Tax=Aquamicrobium defluvii TaxID=69279 RepID=A0A011UT13_9HYPH|nr:ACR family transporter [Aquamicrobium defluvii]EZQ15554.1 ACR family transporter [Halopseudomonas bauzanensis]TDR36232.1 multidrug efflux pump subunit AcrB [Aquamicrobium defluvii]